MKNCNFYVTIFVHRGEIMQNYNYINIDKETKKFFKRAKIKKDDNLSEINDKIICYVSKMGKRLDIDSVYLLENQLSDSKFMIKLFRANSDLILIFSNLNKNLTHNENFALDYLNIVLHKKLPVNIYHMAFSQFTNLLKNPTFLSKVIEKFSDFNIISIIYKLFVNVKEDSSKQKYYNIICDIPTQLLCEQARQFGCEVLLYLPKNIPNYNKIISYAIEKDGFKALSYLDIDNVIDNKELILKAYQLFGKEALSYYLEFSLNPIHKSVYVEDGKVSCKIDYDEKCAEVQKMLFQSAEIEKIYEDNNSNLNWKDKRVKEKVERYKNDVQDDEIEKN